MNDEWLFYVVLRCLLFHLNDVARNETLRPSNWKKNDESHVYYYHDEGKWKYQFTLRFRVVRKVVSRNEMFDWFIGFLISFQASFYSTALKTLISVSTVILLGLIVAYHALEVQVKFLIQLKTFSSFRAVVTVLNNVTVKFFHLCSRVRNFFKCCIF